jgi:hypothetical protein
MAKDGHIYKRGNVYWIKYYRGGKPYYESTKSPKEADAKRLLRQRLGQIAEGRFFGLRPERVRFEDLATDFLIDYRINGKRSLDKAERSVRHLQRFFAGMRAGDITTDRVRTYIGDRQNEGVSNGEINRELAALKRMFNLALQQTPRRSRKSRISRCSRREALGWDSSSMMNFWPYERHYRLSYGRWSRLRTTPDGASGKC